MRRYRQHKHSDGESSDPQMPLGPDDISIIHRYQSGVRPLSAHEYFELELEDALEAGCRVILIESRELGEETARWIVIGSVLENGAIGAALGSLLAAYLLPDEPLLYVPPAFLAALTSGLHSTSWAPDPCSRYRVERPLNSAHLNPQLQDLANVMCCSDEPPLVLLRDSDTRLVRRCFLHRTLSFLALACCAFRVFRMLRFNN
jgi:hypothetical protein